VSDVRPWLLAGVWLLVGLAVWNGFFDLYVSRGAREYLQRQAEFELGRGPEPSMSVVMAQAARAGRQAASWMGGWVVAAGWATIYLVSRPRVPAGR
jgi:hypothetical protein